MAGHSESEGGLVAIASVGVDYKSICKCAGSTCAETTKFDEAMYLGS